MLQELSCFKAYDIRGKVPSEINEELFYKIGRVFPSIDRADKIIVGYDVRPESIDLARAVIKGLKDSGAVVVNIGLCGTEEVYFHCFNDEEIGGGMMITASHNPKGYNGIKLVGKGARPMSLDGDLKKIRDLIINFKPNVLGRKGEELILEDKSQYIEHLLGYIDIDKLKPLRIVVNPGNGPAGIIVKLLSEFLPFEFIYINEEPDGNFPNGVPNPMIVENRIVTSQAVIKHKADLGIAWDGDFDRCFLFDEQGNYIEGYYIVGLLTESFLKKNSGGKIIYDPRLIWNTIDIANENGGTAIQCKSGHSFIKEKMRLENAIYGGEMSAHHYFKQFGYCDSGMVPWLLITELISISNKNLSEKVKYRINKFPCSGEINYRVTDAEKTIQAVLERFKSHNPKIDYTDGISLEFSNWRLNLRKSNTEALIRLNIEVKSREKPLKELTAEVEAVINLSK